MAIAPSFEMALMKAVRGAEVGLDSLNRKNDPEDHAPIWERLRRVDDHRLFTIFEALKSGTSIDEIFSITRIDRWFLAKLKKMAEFEKALEKDGLTVEHYETGKKMGYPDDTLKRLSGTSELPVESKTAVYKMVDTCGAEFDAETPYFYSSFDQSANPGLPPQRQAGHYGAWLRPHPHRSGHRVRLFLRPLRLDAEGAGLRSSHRQQQPRDRLHGL